MNLKYLGDALDHWKGSVFEGLQRVGVLDNLRIDAMASDAKAWRPEDWHLFARLLRVESDQIVKHAVTLKDDRQLYFDEVADDGDLFLDPDTGIKTGPVKDRGQYLLPTELFALMNADATRVVAVYQHIRAARTRDRVEVVLRCLRSYHERFFCTSYESGTVALLFFSGKRARITVISEYFHSLLGSHAQRRIGLWA